MYVKEKRFRNCRIQSGTNSCKKKCEAGTELVVGCECGSGTVRLYWWYVLGHNPPEPSPITCLQSDAQILADLESEMKDIQSRNQYLTNPYVFITISFPQRKLHFN